ncbi:MAG: hypothetical protein CMK07_05345 [Ponticaulis sp.]|nr:hypothetical protein [Ponticaulis sp.]
MKHRTRHLLSFCALSALIAAAPLNAGAVTMEELLERIERLEQQNRELKQEVQDLQRSGADLIKLPETSAEAARNDETGFVSSNADYGFRILDAGEDVNTKPIVQLKARQQGDLKGSVTLSGQITAIANVQTSNRDDKFGYLMRNPTSANQIGGDVSEALIHSANLAVTAQLNDWITGYFEMLYSPEQNFGAGTITALTRNALDGRRAYILLGNLEEAPVFAAVGKLDTPFGLNDSVSPFTNSTNWHAFAGLAYGAQLGYVENGLMIRAMAIQGGAQFRAHNMPVNDTNVPSRLNNFAIDANYTYGFGERDSAMFGASYTAGSAYCQNYPVFHFNPCTDPNPAWDIYSRIRWGGLELLGEYASTTKEWPGSAVPDPTNPLSVYAAQKTSAYTVGARYGFGELLESGRQKSYVSAEFSNFVAGDDGAPWERQNQLVLGYSRYVAENINLFGEYIHVDGFAPLNFVSGGNFPDGSTWSDRDAETEVLLFGAQGAF